MKIVDPEQERRSKFRQHWEESQRLSKFYDANDTDYQERAYPEYPDECRGLMCGAQTKRTGKPCKQLNLFFNGRCKFHGGASTGPKTKKGKRASAKNGRLGGRPRSVLNRNLIKPDAENSGETGNRTEVHGMLKDDDVSRREFQTFRALRIRARHGVSGVCTEPI